MKLGALDFAVIGVPLVLVMAAALYMRQYMRGVADFLAASRCAGRYLICTATGETAASVMLMITMLEVFSKTGFSLRFWEVFTGVIAFFFGLLGLVIYRYRETRSLTFHQLFEMRFSKGIRIFASFLNVFSGIFNFGIQPAVGARFFVYFCGLPDHLAIGGWNVPTFIPVMIFLMGLSLSFALSGGQISVMVTDCLEGVISMAFYIVIAVFIICTISVSEMHDALLSGTKGNSFVDPFDIGGRDDFNGWYVMIGLFLSIYWYRGSSFNQGFIASAKTAHEGRMAGILANWRMYSSGAMSTLVAIAAFTVLHHPDFAAQQAAVQQQIDSVSNSQLATQMVMPTALGVFLAPGIKGMFCAVLLFGLLAAQGSQLLIYGSTFLQDVILPLRKKQMTPKGHLWALRLTILGVAIFVCFFSAIFKPVDYLAMTVLLIGSIYLAGIGAITWGGLYWKKGTTAGAWTALIASVVIGVGANLLQQLWSHINPFLMRLFGPGSVSTYLAAHAAKFPLNGQQLALVAVLSAGLGFIVVSLLTYRKDFDLDEMLHRGKYRLPVDDAAANASTVGKSFWDRFLQIDHHFTRGDRWIMIATFWWTLFWKILAVGIVLWLLLVGPLSSTWWFHYMMITNVWMTLVVGVIVTIWFYIGISRDAVDLFKSLKSVQRIDADDGTVRGHHNAGEELLQQATEEKADRKP